MIQKHGCIQILLLMDLIVFLGFVFVLVWEDFYLGNGRIEVSFVLQNEETENQNPQPIRD